MAVYAAHLTRTLQGSPSIFQLTAQDALGATVKPAFRKIFEYLTAVYPGRFDLCLKWYDELFLLVDACLQYHYLKHYASSFSESFYGLHRVVKAVSNEFSHGSRLPTHLERASLAMLVLVPYFKDKVQLYADKWREEDEEGTLGKSGSASLHRAAYKVHAIVHFVTESVRLGQLAAYLTGQLSAHNPELLLLGLALRNAPPPHEEHDTWSDLLRNVLTGRFSEAGVSFPMVGGLVLRLVEYGAFLVQFLRWWESARLHHAPSLPTPPPPSVYTQDEKISRFNNKCPICLQAWRTPTVLPVSGYVFCYACISRHLRSASPSACPVSKYPATLTDLVRVYLDS